MNKFEYSKDKSIQSDGLKICKLKKNDSIKIMVQFLSNEIRADGLKITVYNKTCNPSNLNNCSTTVNNKDTIGQELKLAILRKAAELKTIQTQKEVEKNRKKIPDDPYQSVSGKD